MTKEIEKIITRFKKEVGKSKGMTARGMKLIEICYDELTVKNCNKLIVSDSAFSQEEEDELQRLVRKIKWNQPTYEDMKKADELTRKKWKSQSIG